MNNGDVIRNLNNESLAFITMCPNEMGFAKSIATATTIATAILAHLTG